MADRWYTEEDATGTLTVDYHSDSWYLVDPQPENEVEVRLLEGVDADPNEGPLEIRGTVSKYMYGTGGDRDHLFLEEPRDSADDRSTAPTNSRSRSEPARPGEADSQDLTELNGTGDYVTVTATVDTVYWVNKDESGIPDVKGELTDDSTLGGVTFVVADGVDHPYLGEGERYEFRGVKDHYYSEKAEVQVMITDHTDFRELG